MILLTGAAGFIGMHVADRLLKNGIEVIGIDNVNDYYDPSLKEARLNFLNKNHKNFKFIKLDISEPEAIAKAIKPFADKITQVIHLAAQAGVRYSLEAPRTYIGSNVNGMLEILETCRALPNLKHLVYASSSSVYGANKEQPFSTSQKTDNPVSLYAATKKSCEVMAESYARLYKIPCTGLRFFTVYGAWGRPDMAYFKFTQNILSNQPIPVYNHGNMKRDFTYVDDIVDGIIAVSNVVPAGDAPHKIYNLGNNKSEKLMDMISLLEEYLNKKAIINFLPMQAGDVTDSYADISDSTRDFGFAPKTSLSDGLKPFVQWYHSYYKS